MLFLSYQEISVIADYLFIMVPCFFLHFINQASDLEHVELFKHKEIEWNPWKGLLTSEGTNPVGRKHSQWLEEGTADQQGPGSINFASATH